MLVNTIRWDKKRCLSRITIIPHFSNSLFSRNSHLRKAFTVYPNSWYYKGKNLNLSTFQTAKNHHSSAHLHSSTITHRSSAFISRGFSPVSCFRLSFWWNKHHVGYVSMHSYILQYQSYMLHYRRTLQPSWFELQLQTCAIDKPCQTHKLQ